MLPYDQHLKARAAELRKNSTTAEILLWNRLKRCQRLGFDFHRQKPILHWIADFFCAELMLAIEIDGDSHRFRAANDATKEAAFRNLGIEMLRFGNSQVRNDLNAVVAQIDDWIGANRAALIHLPPRSRVVPLLKEGADWLVAPHFALPTPSSPPQAQLSQFRELRA